MAEEENEVKQINNKDENKMDDSTKPAELEDKSKDDVAEAKNEVKDESEAKDEEVGDKSDKEEDDASDGEDEDDEDGEVEKLPPGLLEQPLEVEGKRQKRKVERLSATMMRSPTEKPHIEIEEGLGTKLGDIPYVAHYVNITKAADLKSLHKLLFFKAGTLNEIKKNIRKFSGTTEAKDSKEREKRLVFANKMSLTELKTMCLWLGLKQGGTKSDLIGRAMEFLEKPKDQGMEVKKKRKSKSEEKTGVKRKRKTKKTNKEDKPKKKVKKTKKAKTEKEEENEGEEDEEDIEEDEDKEEEEDSEEEKEEEDGEDSEEEAPKKKKPKLEVKKKEKKTPKKAVKENGKEKTTPKKQKQTPKKKATPVKKEAKKKATPKKETAELSDSLSEDSDSEEEPLVKAVKPPSNDEIKKVVKDILDGADLETVTMKTVVKQVYAKYPKFDLSDRKDFIKSTVREVIS